MSDPTFPPQSQWKERYWALRADGRCVTCAGKILLEWPQTARCPDCTESRKPAVKRYVHSAKYKRAKRRYRKRAEVRDRTRAHVRARDLAAKIAGRCKDCRAPCLPDSTYCQRHRDMHRAANRDYWRRKRESVKTGRPFRRKRMGPAGRVKTGRPALASVSSIAAERRKREVSPASTTPRDDLRAGDITIVHAAFRIVEMHNGITAREVGDALDASPRERNAISTALRRLARQGKIRVEGVGPERLFSPIRQRKAA